MSKHLKFIILGAGTAICLISYFLKPKKEDFNEYYLNRQVESTHKGVKGFLDSTKKAFSLAFNLNEIQINMRDIGICYLVNVQRKDDPKKSSIFIGAFGIWLQCL